MPGGGKVSDSTPYSIKERSALIIRAAIEADRLERLTFERDELRQRIEIAKILVELFDSDTQSVSTHQWFRILLRALDGETSPDHLGISGRLASRIK